MDIFVGTNYPPGGKDKIIITTRSVQLNWSRFYMSCIRALAGVTLLSLSVYSHAGVWGPTTHSRANCAGFNESITWHAGHSYNWRVESHHFPTGWDHPHHILNTGIQYTWRAAAYHATEAYSSRGDKWWVNGYHFYYPNGKERLDVMTSVGDCSIYDGWWD